MEETGMNYLWSARKRNALGLPWTFTKYAFTEDRLFVINRIIENSGGRGAFISYFGYIVISHAAAENFWHGNDCNIISG